MARPFPTLDPAARRGALAFALSALAALLLVVAGGAWRGGDAIDPGANPADRWALDTLSLLQRRHAPRPAQNDPVVVGIDERSFAALPEPFALWHRHLGKLVSAMAGAGAAVYAMDVVLPDRLFGGLVPGIDQALLGPMLASRERLPMVFARTVDASGAPRSVHPVFVSAAGGAGRFGEALLPLDADGVVRRFEDRACVDDATLCSFPAAIAAAAGVNQAWSGFVPWSVGPDMAYLSMAQVLAWIDAGDEAELRAAFNRKVVLLGVILPFEDRLFAPVPMVAREPDNRRVPGVMVHAQVLRALLNRGLLQPAGPGVVLLFALLAALCALGRSAWLRAALVAAYLLLLAVAAGVLFDRDVLLPVGTLAAAGVVAALLGAGVELFAAMRSRNRLRAAFEGVLDADTVRRIESGGTDVGTRARRAPVAVMSVRIGGLGAVAESAAPARVSLWANGHLARIERAVAAHGGRIEAHSGERVVAAFGAPVPLRSPARAAMEAAQDLLLGIARLRVDLAAPLDTEPVTVGIAAGEAFAGRLGSGARAQWRVLGAVAHRADELEARARAGGAPVACTDAVAGALAYPPALRRAGDDDGVFLWSPAPLEGGAGPRPYGTNRKAHHILIDEPR